MSKDKELFSIELSAKSRLLMKKLTGHANTLSVKNSMNLIGRQYRKEVKRIFKRKQVRQPSLKWKELAPSTLANKRKKGFGNKEILERTGNLRRLAEVTDDSYRTDRRGRDYENRVD